MVRSKYQNVLDLGEKLHIKDGNVTEENGQLQVRGVAKTQYEKNLIWDEIKKSGGENPSDIMADIKVEDQSVFAYHTIQKGESLSLIAKHYYKDAMKYKEIFEANKDVIKDVNLVHPGQEIVIPIL